MIWHCATHELDTKMPIIMGILNVTPDSFSDGGQHNTLDAAVAFAHEMVEAGARIIDVGGESTRPGSSEIEVDEEIARTIEVVRTLAGEGICVSIDTRHAEVAKAAVEAGASIINDVSGFRDPAMVQVAASSDAGVVVMHMLGEPSTMQEKPFYGDVVTEVRDYLGAQARMLEEAGISPERIVIDPGPGFGKTPQQSLDLMRNLTELVHLGYVVMAAPSRKSYLTYAYKSLENSAPEERDVASAAECLLACEQGAHVMRVHNVAMTVAGLKDLRPYVLLGLGCNQVPEELLAFCGGDALKAKITLMNRAIGNLSVLPDTEFVDASSFYESEPAYYEDQDRFVNAVVLLRSGIAPRELLGYLHRIEDALGRVRVFANGPRTCDLDILDYQLYVYESEELTLPHPRICERDFVVKPILEILPNHVLADGTRVDSVPEADRIGHARLVR